MFFPAEHTQSLDDSHCLRMPGRFFAARSLALSLVLSGLLCLPAAYASALSQTDPSLVKLENKFFQHDYVKEDVASRLERLEKMVFGESKTGSPTERLQNLLSAVPNLNQSSQEAETASGAPEEAGAAPGDESAQSGRPAPQKSARSQPAQTGQDAVDLPGSGQYPAVSAIERKLLGKDYAGEGIGKRIERLEVKAFGKASNLEDLSERVDRLKLATGIDPTKQAPPGSDWSDDDEPMGSNELTYTPEPQPYTSRPGEDGRSFSGRDLRQDMQRAFGRPATTGGDAYAGSGSFGMGGGSRSNQGYQAGGSYGYTPPRGGAPLAEAPAPAPDVVRGSDSPPPVAMGLSQEIGLLENEIFRKTYANETIPIRLNRLEGTVFPGQKPSVDMSLPDRVRRLSSAVPVSTPAGRRSIAQRQPDPDGMDFDDSDPLAGSVPHPAPPRAAGGLSRIMNGLGNFITGGFTGGYPAGANLVNDPQTGLLYDRLTGSLIDPVTGVVVGQRSVASPGAGMMMGGYGSGFSPLGAGPYGYGMGGSNMRFGFGGGGMRFGTGMWP